MCAGTGPRGGPSSLPTTRPNGCHGARPRASIKTLLQERSLVHSAKATRAKRCTQISIQKARAPSTLFESRFSRFRGRGRVARGCGSARPLLILRVAFDASGASTYRVAVPSRSSTRQFGRSMVLICTRAGARPRGAILESVSECQIASLLARGGPRLRPCLAGEICFQLSCLEALSDYRPM